VISIDINLGGFFFSTPTMSYYYTVYKQ